MKNNLMKLLLLPLFASFASVIFNENNKDAEDLSTVNIINPEKHVLSPNASFPSPIIQLQQALAHGLIEVEPDDFPMLSKDIVDLYQKNIEHSTLPPAPELEELKKKLKSLKTYIQKSN